MTETNHTPGPWKHLRALVENAPDRWLIHAGRWGSRGIAEVPIEQEADARLIAAAPELLEALEEIRLLTSRTIHPTDTRQGWEPVAVERLATIERKARAAIAKARGEEIR